MASLPDMNSCWKSYWALQLCLLCVLSSLQLSWTAAISWNQCSPKGLVTDTVGIFGLMPNLTVICERNVAHLNFSTGGNIVVSLRAAQECTVLSTNKTILDQKNIYSVSTSKQHHQWSISPPHLPQDSDIECHYFGCYYIDMYEYDDVDYDDIIDIVILPNATCTFSQLATISSSITPSNSSLSLSSSSFLTTSPTGSSILPIVATSVRKASESSEVLSTHKPTHHTSRFTVQGSQTVTESRKSPISISTVSSHSISTVPSQPSSGSVKSEWIILTIAVLVAVLVITFMSCLLFTSKRYFNSSIKQGIHDPNEPRDKGFIGEFPNNGHIGSGHFVLVVPYRSGDKINP